MRRERGEERRERKERGEERGEREERRERKGERKRKGGRCFAMGEVGIHSF